MIDSLETIQEECKQLIQRQKNSEEISSLTSALLLMGGLELIALVSLYIKEGYKFKILVFLGILMVMFLYYKLSLAKANSRVTQFSAEEDSSNPTAELNRKLSYLDAGLDVKLARIKAVMRFYIIIFPVFLITVQQVTRESYNIEFYYWVTPLLYLISYIVWKSFFNKDKATVELVKNRVSYLSKAMNLITKNSPLQ